MSTLSASPALQPVRAQTASSGAARALRWCTPGLADALFILLLLRVLQLGSTSLFNDPGTGWHLRTGQEIVATGVVPVTDTFSYTRAGEPWVESQWLADVIMSLGYAAGGYPLLALGTAFVIAGLFRWIYRTQIGCDGWPAIAAMVTILAACAAAGHFLARPLVATSIGVPLSFWWATQYARGLISWRRLILLMPISVVWCNLHPGVLGGIATVGVCGVGVLVHGLWTRRTGDAANALLRRGGVLLAVAVGMGAATLVNPYGLDWHGWVTRLMGMKALSAYVVEWKPPGWDDPASWAAAFLVGVAVAAALIRRKGVTFAEGLVVAFWCYYGFGSGRHLPLMTMVVALQLGRLLADVRVRAAWLHRIGARVPLFSADIRATERRNPGGLASVLACLTLLLLTNQGIAVPQLGITSARPSASRYSPGAINYLIDNPPSDRFFNDLNYGGTIIRDIPGLAVYADDRFGLYGEDFVGAYRNAVLEPDTYAAKLLDTEQMDTVLIAGHLPLCEWLRNQADWTEAYCDEAASVFERNVDCQENAGDDR